MVIRKGDDIYKNLSNSSINWCLTHFVTFFLRLRNG